MPVMRPCIECGALVPVGQRCSCTPRVYDADVTWRKTAAATIAAWRAIHGDWCPGSQWCVREGHACLSLVVDHDVGVLGRACNARKAATTDKDRAILARAAARAAHPSVVPPAERPLPGIA